MKSKKIVIFTILPSIVLVALLALGFIAGRYTVIRTFDKQTQRVSRAFTLGGLLNGEQKKKLIHVYHEEEKILEEIDNFSWAVPNIPTPFVGNAPMPGQHGNAYINSAQFRAKKEIELPKPKNIFRIFITGGSTAYSSGAPSQDRTIAGYLEKILSNNLSPVTKLKYEVLTMANSAWASTHERIIIENKLSELEPDMVISVSGNNDVHWGLYGFNVLWFRSYADDYFLNLIKKVYKYINQPDIPEITLVETAKILPSLVSKRLIKNVKLSSFVLSQEGIDYVFMLQPNLFVTGKNLTKREQAKREQKSQEYFQKCYAQIDKDLRDFDGENYRYVNLTNIFDTLDDQEDIFIDSYHFGDKGNEIIAKNIFLHIKDINSQ